jgi:HPt (histidine-containing phosphotransfer) domain-containing protein
MTNASTSQSNDIAAELAVYGIDYEDAMARMLNNGALFKQLAQHYRNDANLAALVEDMKAGDLETAYSHAHTLKGVAGNLSFGQLHALAAQICDALTSGNSEAAYESMDAIEQAHARVLEGLDHWQTLA